MHKSMRTFCVILILFLKFSSVKCLKITKIVVPQVLLNGDSTILRCHFKQEGEPLYSLTWWKDDLPFFKFVPANSRKITIFRMPGLLVDITKSTINEVYLSNVDYRGSGEIKCEVVADQPSFEKDSLSSKMVIVDRPTREPKIIGRTGGYRTGDLLLLNCSSSYSYPKANLSWFINNQQASLETVILYPPEDDGEGRFGSKSGLQMFLKPRHFTSGVLELRCVASIYNVYSKPTEVLIINSDFREPPREGKVAQSTESSNKSSPQAIGLLIWVPTIFHTLTLLLS